jgi:cytochrome c2
MKFAPKSAAALVLLFAVAGCGDAADPTDEVAPTSAAATDTPGGQAIGPTPGETSAPVPSSTVEPTPAATASPTPKPSATTAAVAVPAAFAGCSACHIAAPGVNGIGPSLAGIYGDRAATVPGYDFSDAMKSSGLTWNQGTLDRYLTDPRGVVPGTKMAFGGVKDAAKRQDIINYLKSL